MDAILRGVGSDDDCETKIASASEEQSKGGLQAGVAITQWIALQNAALVEQCFCGGGACWNGR